MSYCVRAEDSRRITIISEMILEEYILLGQEAFINHVDSIPTSLLRLSSPPTSPTHENGNRLALSTLPRNGLTNSLDFLARYRDFFAVYAQGERRRAAELLVLVLNSGAAPKRFWGVLLLDTVLLLDGSSSIFCGARCGSRYVTAEELLFSQDEIYDLLRCLEEIVSPIVSTGADPWRLLGPLSRIVSGGMEEAEDPARGRAMKQLSVVRSSLATYVPV